MREQRVDLERAHQPAFHPLMRLQRGDVVTAKMNASGVGPQHARHQIDESGLAGTVRTDQRVART